MGVYIDSSFEYNLEKTSIAALIVAYYSKSKKGHFKKIFDKLSISKYTEKVFEKSKNISDNEDAIPKKDFEVSKNFGE
ncbi:hypothetical protein PIROE2DRAFT_9664 [Piromyces sp. E2]|nr:hypothetical protein PIROE2DRAFT_9664 [Piromyces sp. E2]|eukprot:OUM63726.1 hypothetical protein PIROE2DRAFT_9664 [Piromyces sp. E2]